MAARNRSAGHSYECDTASDLRKSGLFPHAVTCRSENRTRDGQKVDLINQNEASNGRMEYNIQCKNSCNLPKYHLLLNLMPKVHGIINVVFHRYTKKSAAGKFMAKGDYAILKHKDFMEMMVHKRGYEILLRYLKHLPDEKKQSACQQLHKIGL